MSDNPTMAELTPGEIARRCRSPLHCVDYVIRSRNVRPAARAGAIRVFTAEQVAFINAELRAIQSRRHAPRRSPPAAMTTTRSGRLLGNPAATSPALGKGKSDAG